MPEPTTALTADCASCFGLCCVALPFTASADFAVTKEAGKPCRNLDAEFRCRIHTRLREQGFPGCTVYDCFGAGQQVSQVTFGGADWRSAPQTAREMFEVFPVVRQLHELLWYLTEALSLTLAAPLHGELRALRGEIEELAGSTDPGFLLALDVPAHRARANTLLLKASELVRAAVPGKKRNRRGADLIGAELAGSSLRGADLRGAYLIAADLRKADLRAADLIGADLRDAKLHGADLTGAFFLTQPQLNAAQGDATTTLPTGLARPAHWR
ncbi:pentapeptide repeat-containing protein [Kitasatospora sp. LaBMicrA B282]|uniref:pentapeptide repeat-containing protein n=1 Tax=Kitasatospora sp. LaBMicrA B282 TaxID=3420949 RepID=UPI003D12031A